MYAHRLPGSCSGMRLIGPSFRGGAYAGKSRYHHLHTNHNVYPIVAQRCNGPTERGFIEEGSPFEWGIFVVRWLPPLPFCLPYLFMVECFGMSIRIGNSGRLARAYDGLNIECGLIRDFKR